VVAELVDLPVGRQARTAQTRVPKIKISKKVMYFIYVLESIERNYTYIGLTNDLERRIKQHFKGYNKTTKPYLPFRLIFFENFDTRQFARE